MNSIPFGGGNFIKLVCYQKKHSFTPLRLPYVGKNNNLIITDPVVPPESIQEYVHRRSSSHPFPTKVIVLFEREREKKKHAFWPK
jgi:hypothetical protein